MYYRDVVKEGAGSSFRLQFDRSPFMLVDDLLISDERVIMIAKSILKAINSHDTFKWIRDDSKMKEFIKFIDQRTKWKFSVSLFHDWIESIQLKVIDGIENLPSFWLKILNRRWSKNENYPLTTFILFVSRTFISEYSSFGLALNHKTHDRELMIWPYFWEESTNPQGRLMALLILEMGLQVRLSKSKSKTIQLTSSFERGKDTKRFEIRAWWAKILPWWCSISLTIRAPYSLSVGIPTIRSLLNWKRQPRPSKQSIREQYILKQRELGVDLFSIARESGP